MIESIADPLLVLFTDWEALDISDEQRAKENELETGARYKKRGAIENEMAGRIPLTLAGAVALVRVLRDTTEGGTPPDERLPRILDNLIAGLERMGAA